MKLQMQGKTINTQPISRLIRQGESNVDAFEIDVPRKYGTIDLGALAYTINAVSEENTIASQLLDKAVYTDSVTLIWKVSRDFSAVSGTIYLSIQGVDSTGQMVIKFSGEPIYVKPDKIGKYAPPDMGVFDQALTNMQALVASAQDSEESAAASKTAAASSANTANTKAAEAAASAANAKASETKAKTSETNAKASETAAASSKTAAAASASSALSQANAAKSQADAAAASASNAKASETNSKTSETNAKASETAAKASETAAKASETAAAAQAATAAVEAGKAAASAGAAKTSETSAAASARAAAESATAAAEQAGLAMEAAVRQPVPRDDGFWYVWDADTGGYLKTGFPYQGPPGEAGSSLRILGLYGTYDEMSAAHPTGQESEAWAVGTENNNVIYLWDTERLQWTNLGTMRGLPGKDGEPGPAGKDGADGENAYELAVKNGFSGTEAEWLASLVGEKGADGIIGKDGKSAYQYAVDGGYTGTEAEFTADLSKTKDLSNVANVPQYSASNPPPYPVTSVAGRTGAVTLSKTDVGLSNVNNTSDANKPISTAVQNALNGKAASSHSHSNATTSTSGFLSSNDKSKLDGIAAGAQVNDTAAQILTKLKGVDGSNSGLDADLLDGQHGSYYAPLNHTHLGFATTDALNAKANLSGAAFTGAVTMPSATITGNMRLKGSGNYGNKINFGDGDYVYIYEESDDTLVIKSTKLRLVASEVTINGSKPSEGKRSDTVIVGNAARGHTMACCDYLCGGSNDASIIQNAIGALPANGGTVLLLEGDYKLTSSITMKENTTLKGVGNGTRLIAAGNFSGAPVLTGVGKITYTKICNLAILEGSECTANDATSYIRDTKEVDHVSININSGRGIQNSYRVTNCFVAGGHTGIYDPVICLHNIVENAIDFGIDLYSTSGRRLCQGNAVKGIQGRLIRLYGHNICVIGNICEGSSTSVITIDLTGNYEGCVVIGNILKGSNIVNTHAAPVIAYNTINTQS